MMSVMKRAWLYVTRKKMKSLFLILILFAIATATISGIAIKKATDETKSQLIESIQAGFGIEPNLNHNMGIGDRGLGNMPYEIIQQVGKLDGISKYNAKMIGEIDIMQLKKVELLNPRVRYENQSRDFDTYSDLDGLMDSSIDNKFVSGLLTLTKGRHIQPKDQYKVLVHEEFAAINQLQLHDKITIKKSPLAKISTKKASEKEVELEIIGLFTGSNKESAATSSELLENTLISDLTAIHEFRGHSLDEGLYQTGKFLVENPQDLDRVLAEVKQLPFDWSQFNIVKSENDFPALTGSLDAMDSLIQALLIGTIIVSAIILSLTLGLWINGRIHETGVLLSLGLSKMNIIRQYLIEVLLLACIGFSLAYFSGQFIAQKVGDALVTKANEESTSSLQQGFGGMQLGADPETSTLSKTLDGIQVAIQLEDMLMVWLLGGLIIVLSVGISSLLVMRLKPKEILSKMS